jgi:hypothetical protein
MKRYLDNIKTGDKVKFKINGKVQDVLNTVVSIEGDDILVEVNNPSSIIHSSLLRFNKYANEVRVKFCDNVDVYKIAPINLNVMSIETGKTIKESLNEMYNKGIDHSIETVRGYYTDEFDEALTNLKPSFNYILNKIIEDLKKLK